MVLRSKGGRRVFWSATMGFLLVLFFTLPCSAQKAAPKVVPKGEATIVVQEAFSMTGGDPHTAIGAGAMNITNLIHESLVMKGPDGKLAPALAKSWQFSKDGLSVKFNLNEKAKFHDGTPVTANDVKFSIERALKPELKYVKAGTMKEYMEKVEVTGNQQVTVFFKSPYPALLEWCAQHLDVIPKAYVEKVGDAEFAKKPIGAGPFRWIDGQQDVFVKAEAVPDHYRKVPSVKTINMKFVQEGSTIMAMLKSGEADIVQIPAANLEEVKKDPKLRVVWSKFVYAPNLLFCDLAFPEASPFKDKKVRQAASLAINRKVIAEKLLNGAAEPWGDIFAPYHPGNDPNLKADPYDPQKAKTLLKEAGYPNGFDTTFTFGLLGDKVEAQAIATDLVRIGIRVTLVELEQATFLRNMREKRFRGLIRATSPFWSGMLQPGVAVESVLSSKNFNSYYAAPKVEAAWTKLYGLSDQKEIVKQVKEVSKAWHDEGHRAILWAMHAPFGLSPKVKTYKPIAGRLQIIGLEYLEMN
jgi:peptide/nickel transport system substrate-binding protein